MRLLVLYEKHFNRYFAVPTDKDLHRVCVKILKERLKAGWYEPGPKPEDIGMSLETIRALPEGRFKTEVLKLQGENRAQLQDWARAQEFHEKVVQAIKQPFPKNGNLQLTWADIGSKRVHKRITLLKSYCLLNNRESYEYERVSLDETEN